MKAESAFIKVIVTEYLISLPLLSITLPGGNPRRHYENKATQQNFLLMLFIILYRLL